MRAMGWIDSRLARVRRRNYESDRRPFLQSSIHRIASAPALAHLLELPNKIGLSRDDYLIVQQIYRGWALLGIVVLSALCE